jgi:hypothetical protein
MKKHIAFSLIIVGLLTLLMSVALAGCSSAPTTPVEQPVESTKPPEPTSPSAPAATAESELRRPGAGWIAVR